MGTTRTISAMTYTFPFAAAAAALLLSALAGCSTLNVSVDVLDKSAVDPIAATFSAVDKAVADIKSQGRRDELGQSKAEVHRLIADAKNKGLIAAGGSETAMAKADAFIEKAFADARELRQRAVAEFEMFLTTKGDRKRLDLLRSAQASIKAANDVLAKVRSEVELLVQDVASAPANVAPPDAAKKAHAFRKAIRLTFNSIIVGEGLFDDPYLPVIVGAPDDAWKPSFSNTKAFNALGNSDIAIRAEKVARGNFTLKGVRLDAQKVTQATFQAFKQTIQLVAIAYGVPLPKPAGATTAGGDTAANDPAQSASDTVAQAEASRRAAQTERRRIRRAELNLFQAITDEQTNLDDAAKFSKGATNIKTAFDQYSKLIAPPRTPADATPTSSADPTADQP